MSKPFVVITATGKDKPGLITEITELIANSKGNIVDIEAFSMRGLFAIFMIVDCRSLSMSLEGFRSQLMGMGNKIGLDVAIEALRETWRSKKTTMDELWEASKVCRVSNVMRPYLESIV